VQTVTDQTPAEMRDDASMWSRAGYPQVAVGRYRAAADQIERLRKWIDDLQSRMFVNCVYCGHRYGPEESTPVSMADVLKEHIRRCPEHPLAAAQARIRELEAQCD
jgi:hypothetical protein